MQEYVKQKLKQEFRLQCKLSLSGKKYFPHTRKMQEALMKLLETIKPNSLLLYLPLRGEFNTMPLFSILKIMKTSFPRLKLFVPALDDSTQRISFDVVEFRRQFLKGPYGIRQPKGSKKNPKIEAMVVPVLGLDSSFRRIGFGKGMYDRFYAGCKDKPTIIFIAQSLNLSRAQITSTWDILGDYFIDCKAFYERKPNGRVYYSYISSKWNHMRRSRLFFSKKEY